MEVDRAVRWNTLRIETPTTATASTGDGQYDFGGWFCESCTRDDLIAPPDFTITEWT